MLILLTLFKLTKVLTNILKEIVTKSSVINPEYYDTILVITIYFSNISLHQHLDRRQSKVSMQREILTIHRVLEEPRNWVTVGEYEALRKLAS